MKRKVYKIQLWKDDKYFLKWDVYAENNQEAQQKCEHLKQCCIKYGGFVPVKADIKQI